ncbi:hypothetical protein GCM10027418_28170 [Mariniluteicoccus endophyticus]
MIGQPRIVYYAHHHGSGHLRHARRLADSGVAEVVTVGAPGADIPLPPDLDPDRPRRQPDGSPFHWTPTDPLVRARFSAFHRALDDIAPDAVLVDVSVETAVFAHLAGYPVAHRRMPGERDDPAHRLVYATVPALFAYYPQAVEDPGFAYADRTRFIGMPADSEPVRGIDADPRAVVVVSGAGGDGVPWQSLVRAARTVPDREWHVLGPVAPAGEVPTNLHTHGWVDDPGPWLARAGVIVCGAGHNTVAAAAVARRPVVLAPEPRPHDEQLVFAQRVSAALGTPLVTDWANADWAQVLASPGDADALAEGLLVDRATYASQMRALLSELVG